MSTSSKATKNYRLGFGGIVRSMSSFKTSLRAPTERQWGYITHVLPMEEGETTEILATGEYDVFVGERLDEHNVKAGQFIRCLKDSGTTAFAIADTEDALPELDDESMIYMVGNRVYPESYKNFKQVQKKLSAKRARRDNEIHT